MAPARENGSAPAAVTGVLDLAGLQALIDLLAADRYTVLGPTVADGAVVPGRIARVEDLPRGWGDVQDAGTYQLRRRDDDALFGYAADAVSWKSVLFPARELMWRGSIGPDGVAFDDPGGDGDGGRLGSAPYAVLGIRACDLAAVTMHDRILRDRAYADPRYVARREGAFLVTVTCGAPSSTCFCASMGTGPRASANYDLALTELLEPEHRFLAEAGTERGAEVLRRLAPDPAGAGDLAAASRVAEDAAARMGRALDTHGLKDVLYAAAEDPHWEDVASRCLSCGNCTMVCPTCFCTSVEDSTSLFGSDVERWRVWDSCFTTDYSHLHGGSVRGSIGSRYRQWMTHKLASWQDQFGSSGCVGCGRCIAWCPVGIDITQEAAAIRAGSPGSTPLSDGSS
jgi:sulfhydrogenase subunit beta (sulfur reductase)